MLHCSLQRKHRAMECWRCCAVLITVVLIYTPGEIQNDVTYYCGVGGFAGSLPRFQ
jgi:hypothetical protein